MTITLTKKVNYETGERLDLLDKLAEDTLMDAFVHEYLRRIGVDATYGRVFKGFKTSTAAGPNAGFTIAAAEGVAVTKDGSVCLMSGSAALTSVLSSNSVNYLHLYYEEVESDSSSRRFYRTGTEVSDTINTRITRSCGLYKSTAAYGAPSLGGFSTVATIAGVSRNLIPLYAVVVNNSNVIESVNDYRPMFAPASSAGGNLFDAAAPDMPFDFAPSDVATLGITDIRTALVALADRIKQIKGTTTWQADTPIPLDDMPLIDSGFYGDGSDGAVTISVDTTLSTDKYYDTLIVNSGKALNTNGWRVYVKTSATIDGTVRNNGASGSAGEDEAGGAAGATCGGNTVGTGVAASAGANGTTTDGGSGSSVAASTSEAGRGGSGGDGADSGSGSGGTGGNVAVIVTRKIRVPTHHLLASAGAYLNSGSGGGGGGAGGGSGSAEGGGGGGGGACGGTVFIAAKSLTISATGSVQAIGGDGGEGSTGPNVDTSGGGGGGGGGGGLVYIVYDSLSNSGTLLATEGVGGSGGASGGGTGGVGASGDDGSPGRTLLLNRLTGAVTVG